MLYGGLVVALQAISGVALPCGAPFDTVTYHIFLPSLVIMPLHVYTCRQFVGMYSSNRIFPHTCIVFCGSERRFYRAATALYAETFFFWVAITSQNMIALTS